MESELETLREQNLVVNMRFEIQSKELEELRNNFQELKNKYEKQHENEELVKSNLKTLEDENKSLKIENDSINQRFETQSKELDGVRNNFDELKRKHEKEPLFITKKFLHFENPLNGEPEPHPPPASPSNGDPLDSTEVQRFSEDLDSACSTPYFSAPSSPSPTGFFYSAPSSPMPFVFLSSAASPVAHHRHSSESSLMPFQYQTVPFEFSSSGSMTGSMSSADELFLNGKIRPMEVSSRRQKQQILAPLIDQDVEDEEIENKNGDPLEKGESSRGRDLKHLRSRSVHRRARFLSLIRNLNFFRREEALTANEKLARAFWRVCKIMTRSKSVSNFEIGECKYRCQFCESPLALKDDVLSQVRTKVEEIKN